ncbi:hypothetical protein CH380_18470 [Leptospira adleri]|uniref:Uncharacterized protein n=1 Tax=Leptospira adleri TaxID=2023186 RepID=A0A2M9YJL4_9LEPT|nr:hypothetical protein CH380_18470 [Leptospira adleri]PJZ60616.1 hypothetical protein CH376_17375 [Leptospira adleri]
MILNPILKRNRFHFVNLFFGAYKLGPTKLFAKKLLVSEFQPVPKKNDNLKRNKFNLEKNLS